MLIALLLSPAFAGSWPPGTVIAPGISADITKEGFDSVADLIPSLLPDSIPVPAVGDGYAGLFDQCWAGGYEYSVDNATVSVEVVSATIAPGDGVLDVDASLLVSLNDPSDPFQLGISLECLDQTCNGYVNPFPVDVHTTISMAVVDNGDGTKGIDSTVGTMDVTYELDGASDITLSDCTIGDVEEVLNYVGISIYDLILSLVGSTLNDQIASLGPTIEDTLDGALANATIEQDLDVNGASVHLLIGPNAVEITPDSMRIIMEGSFDGAQATCIADVDPGGSLKTDSELPGPTDVPSGIPTDYHAGVLIGDDFADSALYAFWRGGLLCYDLDSASSPIPLDTSILNLLTGDAFAPLFLETQPMSISTRPLTPPEVVYTGEHDLDLSIKNLNVDMYAELDGRPARMISIALDGTAGADLQLDGSTGSLAINVDLDPSKFTPSVSYNEIDPSANDTVVEKFGGLFQTILDTVVGGLLDSLAFQLPSFSGLGLTDLKISETGDQKDWLGAYAWLGPVTYSGGGCGGCGGGCGGADTAISTDTGSSSCGGTGCATIPTAPWAAVGFAALWMRRRRE